MKEVFIDGLPVTIRSGLRMFWGHELEAYLTKLTQYADKPRVQQESQLEELRVVSRRIRVNERLRCETVVATGEDVEDSSAGSRSRSIEKKDYAQVPS